MKIIRCVTRVMSYVRYYSVYYSVSVFTCLKMLNTDTLGLTSSSVRLTTGRFSAGPSRKQTNKQASIVKLQVHSGLYFTLCHN